jgi:uncharacterized protein (DUF2345 family)
MIAKPKECQQKQKTNSKKAKKQKAKKPKSQSKKPKSQKWIQLVLPNPIASFSSKSTKLKIGTKLIVTVCYLPVVSSFAFKKMLKI